MEEIMAYEYPHFEWECPYCNHTNCEEFVSEDCEDEEYEVMCENCQEVSQIPHLKIA